MQSGSRNLRPFQTKAKLDKHHLVDIVSCDKYTELLSTQILAMSGTYIPVKLILHKFKCRSQL